MGTRQGKDELAAAWDSLISRIRSYLEQTGGSQSAEEDVRRLVPIPRVQMPGDLDLTKPTRPYEILARLLQGRDDVCRIASHEGVNTVLKSVVQAAVADLRAQGLRAAARYAQLFDQGLARAEQQWTMVAPIFGVKLKTHGEVRLGQTQLIALGSPAALEMKERLTTIVRKNKALNEAAVASAIAWATGPLTPEKNPAGVCVVTTVGACDWTKAKALGLSAANEFASALRLFQYGLHWRFPGANIGVGLESREFNLQVVSLDGKGTIWGHRSRPGYTTLPLELTDRVLAHINLTGWSRLSEIWSLGEKASKWERRIRGAVYWGGSALDAPERRIIVANLATAVEMLVCGNRQAIADDFRERVGILAGGDHPSDREAHREAAGRFYTLRSNIVHEGRRQVTDRELAETIWLTWHTIRVLLKLREVHSFDAMRSYCCGKAIALSAENPGE